MNNPNHLFKFPLLFNILEGRHSQLPPHILQDMWFFNSCYDIILNETTEEKTQTDIAGNQRYRKLFIGFSGYLYYINARIQSL